VRIPILGQNPVLQRELLTSLRSGRAFILQAVFVAVLGTTIYLAWPQTQTLALESAGSPDAARGQGSDISRVLFRLFTLGQFVVLAMLAPSFAAGGLTSEKEGHTYEMLLAAPLKPHTIVFGKFASSTCFLGLLIFSSLPLMSTCYLLGGISRLEVGAAYVVLIGGAILFGMVSLACSSTFVRTASALVVSYLAILPVTALVVLVGVAADETFQLAASIVLWPLLVLVVSGLLYMVIHRRLQQPPDLGVHAADPAEEEEANKQAMGLVIRRDLFPDRLFAPAKRTDLLPDGANPVLDKELRSEIFAQGTLMLRVVIQVAMFLSIPLMGWFVFISPHLASYYVGYVVTFAMLVGPVFSAGAITQERERGTIELLLTTLLRPWQIMAAKWFSALRVSTVLTLLLTEQMLLGFLLVDDLRANFLAFFAYMGIILVTCLTTTTLGLFCSMICKRSSGATILTYAVLLVLFIGPLGVLSFLTAFTQIPYADMAAWAVTSPYAAAVSVPLQMVDASARSATTGLAGSLWIVFLVAYPIVDLFLLACLTLLFRLRWRATAARVV
jgi:ABC-type transport system involved in multi-copper enzyme maturation permease subunit